MKVALLLALFASSAVIGEPVNSSYRVTAQHAGYADCGSGTAINQRWLVTCRHVVKDVGRGGRVLLSGRLASVSGEVVALDEPTDVALVYVGGGAGFPEWVELAQSDPTPGDKVAIYGYGRSGILRGGVGTLARVAGYRETGLQRVPVFQSTLHIQSGDSGSGLFNEAGELCGINWGSEDQDPGNGIEGPSQSTGALSIRQQITYYETQCYGPWCPVVPPRGARPQFRPQSPGGGTLSPVAPSTPAPAQLPPLVPVPKATDELADRLSAIEGRIGEIEKAPTLEPCRCDPAAQQAAILAAVEISINKAIAGIKFPAPAPIPAASVHFVVVGDPAADYWRRLNDATKGAAAVYSGIKTALPPTYPTGAMPALVQYRGAVPVAVFRGQREVEEKLEAIKRGDYPPAN